MEADVPKTGARDEQSLFPVDTLGGQHVINGAVAIFTTSANRCSPSNGPFRDGELFTIYLCYHWRPLTQCQSCGCKVFWPYKDQKRNCSHALCKGKCDLAARNQLTLSQNTERVN